MPEVSEDQEPFVVAVIGLRAVDDCTVPRLAFLDRDMPGGPDFTDEASAQSRYFRKIVDRHPGHEWPASKASSAVHVYAADLVEPSASDPYWPTVQEFIICGLPDGHELWESYAVKVYCRGAGWWSVKRLARHVTRDGEEMYCTRDDSPESTPELFMDVNTALRVASKHAKEFRLRGRTAADVLAADQAERAPAN